MGFSTILRLKKFLTPHNLELLDVVLGGLVTPAASGFPGYWQWFVTARGGRIEDVTYTVKQLEALRGILQEYLADERKAR